jgi:RNA polymerase sigma-70 factor, ECF subfamily
MLSALLITPMTGAHRQGTAGAEEHRVNEAGSETTEMGECAAGSREVPRQRPLTDKAGAGVVLSLPERPASRIEDLELVERAREGDSWAREAIFRRYVTLVAAAAQRLLRDPVEVDDVVQEAFLIAFEQLDRLAQPAALRGWLLQIAVSRVHRRFRSWRLWRAPAGDTAARLEMQAASGVSPEQRAELALVDRALENLALPLRTAWVLRRVEGHSLEDTALACGCSLATVKRRIGRADEMVQEYLDGGRR